MPEILGRKKPSKKLVLMNLAIFFKKNQTPLPDQKTPFGEKKQELPKNSNQNLSNIQQFQKPPTEPNPQKNIVPGFGPTCSHVAVYKKRNSSVHTWGVNKSCLFTIPSNKY